MNKKYLFFINLSVGITLAIQALLHPTLEMQTKTGFIIAAVVFINWAIFTWLAYSVAMKENSFPFVGKPSQNKPGNTGNQDWKLLLDITTIAYQVVILSQCSPGCWGDGHILPGWVDYRGNCITVGGYPDCQPQVETVISTLIQTGTNSLTQDHQKGIILPMLTNQLVSIQSMVMPRRWHVLCAGSQAAS